MTFRPLHDRVLVVRDEADDVTAGGIIIPDVAKEQPQICRVVAVGDGFRLESGERLPLAVKPNDVVLISKWAGDETKVDGVQSLIIRESDILGVID